MLAGLADLDAITTLWPPGNASAGALEVSQGLIIALASVLGFVLHMLPSTIKLTEKATSRHKPNAPMCLSLGGARTGEDS